MRRLQQVLCLVAVLIFCTYSASYADDFVPAQISPAMQDSLNSVKEPTLQEVLDGLGYDIDVVNDKLPTEVWEVIAGDYYEVMLAEIAGYSDQTASGWYVAGDPSDTTVIFTPENQPGDSAFFQITGCDSNGLFIAPFAGGAKCDYVYYTEDALNPDHMDHAWVYCSGQRPNEFVIAWEDVINNGDNDHNDLVLIYRMPNRPPVVVVPNDTSYSFCEPEIICFDVSASDQDLCGDTVTLVKIEGPGEFEDGTCCFLPGTEDDTYTFVFVATDLAGDADTAEVVITVDVNQPPQITCPDDDDVQAGSIFVSTDFSVADPDGGSPTVTLCGIVPSPTSQPAIVGNHVEWQTDCADAGNVFTICLEATDDCGIKDTCYFDVTVSDTEPPEAECPSDITKDTDPGVCTAVVPFSIDATDNCPGVTVVANPPSGSTFPKGITPVEVIATDASGNKDTCYFNVTVNDTEPPVAQCPSDITVDNDPGLCSAVVPFSIDATDNCPGVTVVANPPSGSTFSKGTTPVEVIATDESGNKDTCYFNVTVNDTEPPVAQCPSDITEDTDPGVCTAVVDFSISATDNCPGVTVIANPPSGSTFSIGLTTVEVIAEDEAGNADTCYFDVTVYNDPPVLTCPDDGDVHAGENFVSSDFSFSDPEGHSVSVMILSTDPTPTETPTISGNHVEWTTTCDEDGDYTICLEATDQCGAKDTCCFVVTVYNQPPVLTCPDDDDVNAGDLFTSTDYSVTDPDDASGVNVVLHSVSPSPTYTASMVGTHVEWPTSCADLVNGPDFTFTLIATDPCGAADTCEFVVTVYNLPPVIDCPEDDSAHAGELFISTDFAVSDPKGEPVTVALCGIDPTPVNQPTIVENHLEWQTDCADDGIFTFCLEATDSCGAKDTCYFEVTVYNRPPQITCPPDGSIHAGEYLVSSDFTGTDLDGDPLSFALCGVTPTPTNPLTLVDSHLEWQTACEDAGITFTICMEATDPCGLKDTCHFDINVYNQPPVLSCPDDDSTKIDSLFISTDFSATDPDDPGQVIVSLSSVSPTPTQSPIVVDNHVEWTPCSADWCNGPDFVVTLVATDPCDAADTCSFVITVYNLPPILVPPPDDSVHAGRYFISENFSVSDQKGPVTVNICGIVPASTHMPTIVESHVELQTECDEAGTIFTICLEAVDDCGAADTGYFAVTVYNRNPVISCPVDDTVHAGETFVSTDFSASDPDVESVTITLCGVTPTPINSPQTVGNHLEWQTDCLDQGIFTICLEAADSCGAKDTCYFEVTVQNQPPVVSCPDDGSVHATEIFTSTDFLVTDPDGDSAPVMVLDITPSATNNPTKVGTHVEWVTTCDEDGDYTIRLVATDPCGAKDTCEFVVTVYNQPPQITCPDNGSVDAGDTFTSTNFSKSDPDGDATNVVLVGIDPSATYDPEIVGNQVKWITTGSESGSYTITLRVTDECGLTDECSFHVQVLTGEPVPIVKIGTIECVNPGDLVMFPINISNGFPTPIGGFELHIDFDYTSMTFVQAKAGDLIDGQHQYGDFEEFTYRLLPCPLCACCKYKILLFGMYDLPDEEMGTPIPTGVTGELVELYFVINSDENLRGYTIPVCWQWQACDYEYMIDPECSENTFSDETGNILYTSWLLCQFDPDCCDDPGAEIHQTVMFQVDGDSLSDCEHICGGIPICDEGTAGCKRGDVNLNYVTYEVADAVLFASYFTEGMDVFTYDVDAQVCGTDVNADGRTLTLSDLVYLIRVILHDAVEIPKLAPSSEIASMIVTDGVVTAECASPIGALLFEFDGAVNPTLLANNMEMMANDGKVLVWSRNGQTIQNAEVLSFAGAELVSIEAVDSDSRTLETVITARMTPTAFALHAAYPNPFNPYVNLSFSLPEAATYSLRIYNVAGQLVRSYEGMGSQGFNSITWDGRDNSGSEVSSGVYFYKLTAAGNSATEKMVMMK